MWFEKHMVSTSVLAFQPFAYLTIPESFKHIGKIAMSAQLLTQLSAFVKAAWYL